MASKSEEEYQAGFRQLLPPWEPLLFQIEFTRADGKVELQKPLDTRSSGQKAAEAAAMAALSPLVLLDGSPISVSRMAGGTAVYGHLGSCAHLLNEAYSDLLGKSRSKYLMVTDRRLLLASRKIFGKNPDFAIHVELPRQALAHAEVDGRAMARGRVPLYFADGSMYALLIDKYFTDNAENLVQALHSPVNTAPPPAQWPPAPPPGPQYPAPPPGQWPPAPPPGPQYPAPPPGQWAPAPPPGPQYPPPPGPQYPPPPPGTPYRGY